MLKPDERSHNADRDNIVAKRPVVQDDIEAFVSATSACKITATNETRATKISITLFKSTSASELLMKQRQPRTKKSGRAVEARPARLAGQGGERGCKSQGNAV